MLFHFQYAQELFGVYLLLLSSGYAFQEHKYHSACSTLEIIALPRRAPHTKLILRRSEHLNFDRGAQLMVVVILQCMRFDFCKILDREHC